MLTFVVCMVLYGVIVAAPYLWPLRAVRIAVALLGGLIVVAWLGRPKTKTRNEYQ